MLSRIFTNRALPTLLAIPVLLNNTDQYTSSIRTPHTNQKWAQRFLSNSAPRLSYDKPNGEVDELLRGLKSFSEKECQPDSSYNRVVNQGQQAQIATISCSDSLVDPTTLTGTSQAGTIFAIRNIAGLVPPYEHKDINSYNGTMAGIEHAVCNLKVKHIIVMGHGNCGGISALLKGQPEDRKTSFISQWVQMANPVKEEIEKKYSDLPFTKKQTICEQGATRMSVENLMTFPWIKERVEAGELKLHGWHFDRGRLSVLNQENGKFETAIERPGRSV